MVLNRIRSYSFNAASQYDNRTTLPSPVTKTRVDETGKNDESFFQWGISGQNFRLFLILKKLCGSQMTHISEYYFCSHSCKCIFILVSNYRNNVRNGCLISPYFSNCLTSLVLSAKVRIKEISFGEAALQSFEFYWISQINTSIHRFFALMDLLRLFKQTTKIALRWCQAKTYSEIISYREPFNKIYGKACATCSTPCHVGWGGLFFCRVSLLSHLLFFYCKERWQDSWNC